MAVVHKIVYFVVTLLSIELSLSVPRTQRYFLSLCPKGRGAESYFFTWMHGSYMSLHNQDSSNSLTQCHWYEGHCEQQCRNKLLLRDRYIIRSLELRLCNSNAPKSARPYWYGDIVLICWITNSILLRQESLVRSGNGHQRLEIIPPIQ